MTKIFITFLLSNLLFLQTFALGNIATGSVDSIVLSPRENKVTIDKSFNLKFSIEINKMDEIGDVEIKGIEQFYKFGENSFFRFESINGENKGIYDILITLKPRDFGKFVVGPAIVKVGDEVIESNTIEIEVTGINNTNSGSNTESILKEGINEIYSNDGPKGFTYFKFWYVFGITVLVVGFFFIFYFFVNYYIRTKDEVDEEDIKEKDKKIDEKKTEKKLITIKTKKVVKKSEKIENKVNNIKDEKNEFLDKLNKIKSKIEILNKSEFYSEINLLLREIIEFKGVSGTKNMTLKELSKYKSSINNDLFKIVEKAYFEEFKNTSDTIDSRKELLSEIKKYI